jgi:hypothetical protein
MSEARESSGGSRRAGVGRGAVKKWPGRPKCPPRDAARCCAAVRVLIDRAGGDKRVVAERVGVSEVSLNKYLRGAVGPSRGTIGHAAAALWPGEYDPQSTADLDAARARLLKMTVAQIEALSKRSP